MTYFQYHADILERFPDVRAGEDVGRATRDLVELLVAHQPGPEVNQSILSSARPRFDSGSEVE